jgi:Heterokaryon incompatibility protein (HET)
MMPKYRYSALSQPTNIRLLLLLPGNENSNDVRGKLFQCNLRRPQQAIRPYEALSYFWGSDDKTESITIVDDRNGDQELAITPNLHAALEQLQDRDIPRVIWIDAICIDQSEKVEKGHQLPLMAEIYARANRVIVWLGKTSDGSSEALEAIRLAAENPVDSLKTDERMEKGISKLLKRSWFQRIWVRGTGVRVFSRTKLSS